MLALRYAVSSHISLEVAETQILQHFPNSLAKRELNPEKVAFSKSLMAQG
jgi:hypothetical protein